MGDTSADRREIGEVFVAGDDVGCRLQFVSMCVLKLSLGMYIF